MKRSAGEQARRPVSIETNDSGGITRRQLLAAGASVAGVAAGLELVGSASPAKAASSRGVRASAPSTSHAVSGVDMSVDLVSWGKVETTSPLVVEMSFPYDAATGKLVSGPAELAPIVVSRVSDGKALKWALDEAAGKNAARTVVLQYESAVNPSGKPLQTITLRNASIADWKQYLANSDLREDITLVFEAIAVT